MDIRDLFDAENFAQWTADNLRDARLEADLDCLKNAHSNFRALAGSLGYRVERIGDGINTGKPAVMGGV